MGSKMSQKERVDTNHLGSKYKTVDPSPVEKESRKALTLVCQPYVFNYFSLYNNKDMLSQPSLICGEKLQVNHYHINSGITL